MDTTPENCWKIIFLNLFLVYVQFHSYIFSLLLLMKGQKTPGIYFSKINNHPRTSFARKENKKTKLSEVLMNFGLLLSVYWVMLTPGRLKY